MKSSTDKNCHDCISWQKKWNGAFGCVNSNWMGDKESPDNPPCNGSGFDQKPKDLSEVSA